MFKWLENIYSICWFETWPYVQIEYVLHGKKVFFCYSTWSKLFLWKIKIVFWVIKSQVCSWNINKKEQQKLVTINLPLKKRMLLLSCIHFVSVENHFSVDTWVSMFTSNIWMFYPLLFFIDDKCMLYMLCMWNSLSFIPKKVQKIKIKKTFAIHVLCNRLLCTLLLVLSFATCLWHASRHADSSLCSYVVMLFFCYSTHDV